MMIGKHHSPVGAAVGDADESLLDAVGFGPPRAVAPAPPESAARPDAGLHDAAASRPAASS